MGSSRLPKKVLLPLGETDVLTYVVNRCKEISNVLDVIVATSTLEQDDPIVDWCNENNVACFRGSELDVLDRYVQCAKKYHPDYVMRVTSDCPFVDYQMATEMISLMEKERKDIVLLEGEIPRGLAVELISFQALLRVNKEGMEARHREHVTYYAYEYKDQFSTLTYKVPVDLNYPQLRITLDTEEDYRLLSQVAEHNDILVSSKEVVTFLNSHPEIAKLNAHIEQKPVI